MLSTQTIIITGISFWVLTCIAVVDIARKDFGGIEKKAAWGFAALVPFIGPLVYFAVGFKKGRPKIKKDGSDPAAKS